MDIGRGRVLCCALSSPKDWEAALAGARLTLIARLSDPVAALDRIGALSPDIVLADAVLPGMDGPEFFRRVRGLRLNRVPALVLMKPAGMALPAPTSAAVLERPLSAESLAEALRALPVPRLDAEKRRRLRTLMDRLGVPEHPGRRCLMNAVELAWADRERLDRLGQRLYPLAGAPLNLSAAQAERAMRHAIDIAWRTGEIEQQQAIFGDTIDARRGKPTCGEMIALLADILRWEG